MPRRLSAVLAAGALLATPAAALAQSAGDDQYTDPFGDVESQEQPGGGASPPAGAEPAAPVADAETATPSGDGTTSDGGTSLPQTGFPAALAALLGAALVGGGASLRRRARPPAAPPPWLTPGVSRSRLRRRLKRR